MKANTIRVAVAAVVVAIAVTSTFAAPTPENTPDYFVDWVRSRSNLYVDTGVAGKVGVKAEVSFYYIQHDTYPVMLGAWGAEKERFNLVLHENRRCRWEYGHYDSGQFSNPAMTGMDSNGVNVSMDTEYGTLCDVTVECSATGAMSSTWTGSNGNSITATMNASEKYGIIDTKATLFLFAAHRKSGSTDGPSQYAYGILRSCKLWTDYDGTGTWTPARDLRPCVKNGRAGLYDAVTEEILYPQGNELEAGPAKLDSGYALGSTAHPGTQWGRIGYAERGGMGNSQWMHLLLTDYTAKGAGDIANLNGSGGNWQNSNLKWSQVRFDGWFQVSSDKAGTWKINQKYDDYFAIFIDGRNVLFNNSYTGEANSTLAVTEGWHRFTIIAGDTYGGYGCSKNYSGLGSIPFSVSVNDGAAMAFSTSNFPQGSGSNSYTLTSDEDWSDRGPILLSGGAVLDLNGHNLVVKDIACDDFVGSCITNSASKKSVLYFAGEPLETKAYVDSLIKEVDVKIILAQDGDQVSTWTGAVSGDPANANNWEDLAGEPVVPTASYTVKIAGNNVNLQAPAGTDIACKAFEIGNCTLATDCDWRGLSQTPLLVGAANLNGHNLHLPHLAAAGGSFANGVSGTTSEVRFTAADTTYSSFGEGAFIDNIANLSLASNVRIALVKEGEGTFSSSGFSLGNQSYEVDFVQPNGTANHTSAKIGINGHHGVYRMSGGTVKATGDFEVGPNGVGEFLQSGGSVTLQNWFNIGRYKNGNGTYTITGGSLLVNKASNGGADKVYVGNASNSSGTLNVGGSGQVQFSCHLSLGSQLDGNGGKGYVNVSGNGNLLTTGNIWIGQTGGETGEFRQTGGIAQCNGTTYVCNEDNSSGLLDISGTGEYRAAGGMTVGANGSLYVHDGGRLVAKSISTSKSTATATFDGGTIVATNVTDGANFIKGLNNVKYGPGGLTLDTAGYDVTMATASGANVLASAGSTFTKMGSGTLTVAAVPPVGNMVVSNGTLSLSASCDNTAMLAHRWSFTSDLTDSVTGTAGDATASAGVTYSDGKASLTGGNKGTCYINLGANKLPSDSVTLEFWTTITTRKVWTKMFCLGKDSGNCLAFTFNRNSDSGVSGLDVAPNGDMYTGTGTLDANTPYYLAFTLKPNASGGTEIKGYCYNATTGALVGSFTQTLANWSLIDKIIQQSFCLGYSFWNDPDAYADYDEVRVWRGALDDTAIALSAAKGPDATAADIAEIVAANAVPVKRTLELASGAMLSIASGQTLTQPVVKGSGTIAGGTLVVSDKIVSTVGECIEASGTIDLSNAKIELVDPENLASPFTFLKPTAGQTLTVIGIPTPTNLTNRWKVSVSADGTGRIVKRGFMIIVK